MLEGRYNVKDHVCRHCLGRVLEQNGRFVCSSCEWTCSLHPRGICGCGMRPPSGRVLPGSLGKAFHCGPNPLLSASSPARIVVLYGDTVINPLDVHSP